MDVYVEAYYKFAQSEAGQLYILNVVREQETLDRYRREERLNMRTQLVLKTRQ